MHSLELGPQVEVEAEAKALNLNRHALIWLDKEFWRRALELKIMVIGGGE